MRTEKIDLYKYFHVKREGAKAGLLTVYRHDESAEKLLRPAMLVIPGGAYAMVSPNEGEPVALEYFRVGAEAFVLDYDVAPVPYPAQIRQAAMAMMYIRKNAQAFGILPDKIAAVGFSAGGHLLGCISTLWDDPAVKELFGEECEKVRPDASVYSYAVVSCDEKIWHRDSFHNFCGQKVCAEAYSIEKKVRPGCAPAFIWGNTFDECVPVQNSLRLYAAYLEAGVPAELHIFREGWHGMNVCDWAEADCPARPVCAYVRPWIELSRTFLKTLGFLPRSL